MKRIAAALFCAVVAITCTGVIAAKAPTKVAEPAVNKGLKKGCGLPPERYGAIPRSDCFFAEIKGQTVTVCGYGWVMRDPAGGAIGCTMRLVQPNCGDKFFVTPDSLICQILEPGTVEQGGTEAAL